MVEDKRLPHGPAPRRTSMINRRPFNSWTSFFFSLIGDHTLEVSLLRRKHSKCIQRALFGYQTWRHFIGKWTVLFIRNLLILRTARIQADESLECILKTMKNRRILVLVSAAKLVDLVDLHFFWIHCNLALKFREALANAFALSSARGW